MRLAELYVLLKLASLSLNLYRKAQDILFEAGIVDNTLNAALQSCALHVGAEIDDVLIKTKQAVYYQKWKPAKDHPFPTNKPYQLELRPQRSVAEINSRGIRFFDAYLNQMAIETNHVESTLLLTQNST